MTKEDNILRSYWRISKRKQRSKNKAKGTTEKSFFREKAVGCSFKEVFD